ncbi:MAG: DUF4331 family protein, partial [Bacteroidia bacterium]|nr:DUF4331 family protein [Bacteroidia bacterium]
QAAVLGLTDPAYASNANLEFIPNMDGFPNGRRLEDDVTRIELQAVSGVVLAAIGLWYDDFDGTNPVSQDLIDVLTYTTGVEANDTSFKAQFPYVQTPWSGDGKCGGAPVQYSQPVVLDPTGTLDAPTNLMVNTDTAFLAPLTWTDNTTNETGYIVRRTVPGMGTQTVATLGPNSTRYTDTVLVFGKPVSYQVLAVQGAMQSMPSNTAVYSMPAKIKRLKLSFVCYDAGTDSLTWNVLNPNSQFIPYIFAQWWSTQRDTLYAVPGNSEFRTKRNAQSPATFGDDNITGIWWADERLLPGQPNHLVFHIPLNVSCGTLRRGAVAASPGAGGIFAGKLARSIQQAEFERQFLAETVQTGPNPFTGILRIEGQGIDAVLQLRVRNLAGQQVYAGEVNLAQPAEVDLSRLAAGVYVVELRTPNAAHSWKVVKE